MHFTFKNLHLRTIEDPDHLHGSEVFYIVEIFKDNIELLKIMNC